MTKPKASFANYFSQNVAASFDKQNRLGEFLGQHNWSFAMDSGLLTFTTTHGNYPFQIQLLGTEAEDSATWLWSWANEGSNIPARLTKAALDLKELGEKEKILEFSEPEMPVEEDFNGHHFAMVASGLAKAGCYYRGPYNGGALYMLITDPKFEELTAVDPATLGIRIPSIFTQVISALPVQNHREAFKSYLEFYGLDVTEDPESLIGSGSSVKPIKATFDKQNRLIEVQSQSGK